MAKFTVKDLRNALKNLDESKEVIIVSLYGRTDNIKVEYVKELQEDGKDYYKIIM